MSLISHWNTRMDAARAGTEFVDIRPADMRVFGNLRGRSVRLSAIHKEMSFSRQAAQQAVDRLVKHGMLEVTLDPNSKRDKLVSITEKGHRWRSIAADQIRQIETEIADVIGDDAKEELRSALTSLLQATQK
ncbi:MarR family protein [Pelagimonas phthalicica]|uniref:MarR family protein n=2 Tax=Pelagimonas phthalicica TaxID=1037362 RepID=A0A238JC91_9RHOB|nr:MarR family transcriptional regulator [Pelagimonas phthalicica]SMX27993.1 MarR family protein [Pelagimonas phthalicica]